MDTSNLFKLGRSYYDSDKMIKAYVDMHYVLSLSRASIDPPPSEEWLVSLSDAVLDHWKVGESFIDKQRDLVVFCDPAEVAIGVGSTASDKGYKFEFPDHWKRMFRQEPLFILNTPDPYAIRGVPVAYRQISLLSKVNFSGANEKAYPGMFDLNNLKTNQRNAQVVANRIGTFRRKLGHSINQLWPSVSVNFYVIGASDVIGEAKKFGFM